MPHSHLVVGLVAAEPVAEELLGLRLAIAGDEVRLGLHPSMAHDLSLLLLRCLSDGTSRGIFPPHLLPMMQPTTAMRSAESGVEVDLDLSDGLRIVSEMPWPVAREFAEKMLALCDAHDAGPSGLN